MNWFVLLNNMAKHGLVLYLVSHGVSLPADSQVDLRELATALYYGSFSWVWTAISFATSITQRSWHV